MKQIFFYSLYGFLSCIFMISIVRKTISYIQAKLLFPPNLLLYAINVWFDDGGVWVLFCIITFLTNISLVMSAYHTGLSLLYLLLPRKGGGDLIKNAILKMYSNFRVKNISTGEKNAAWLPSFGLWTFDISQTKTYYLFISYISMVLQPTLDINITFDKITIKINDTHT